LQLQPKKKQQKIKKTFIFLTYVFSILGSACHSAINVVYLYETGKLSIHQDPFMNAITGLALVLNFVMVYIFLFLLGASLSTYSRQYTHIRYFGALPVRDHAEELDLPTLPLNSIENAMAWMKIRSFIKGHNFLPLTTANVVLGYVIIMCFAMWLMVAIFIFSSTIIFTTITVTFFYDAMLMTVYVVITFYIGSAINGWQEKHISMMYKEQLKLSLQIRQKKEELRAGGKKYTSITEEINQYKGTKDTLHILANIIEKQESSFSILGFSISETATKAILGLTISIAVATIARVGLDLTEK